MGKASRKASEKKNGPGFVRLVEQNDGRPMGGSSQRATVPDSHNPAATDEPSDDMGFYDVAKADTTTILLTATGAIMFVYDLAGKWPYGVLPLFSARLLIILANYVSRSDWILSALHARDPEKEITLTEALLRALGSNKRKELLTTVRKRPF